MDLTESFCNVDSFVQQHFPEAANPRLLAPHRNKPRKTKRTRRRQPRMFLSEVMTILIWFHQSHYRDFKHFYLDYVRVALRAEFPQLVSYNRMVELSQIALIPLALYLKSKMADCSGLSFVDSTKLAVCALPRAHQHRLFKKWAKKGKTSVGWFYGFKLHLVVNDQGELVAFTLTAGNTDDRKGLRDMVNANSLWGEMFGDKGYIGQELFEELLKQGIQLITKIKKNMKNKLMPLWHKLMLRKRALIESVNDSLKNVAQVEHTRHRSVINFLVNLVCALISYCLEPKKPSLHLRDTELSGLPVVL